MEKILETEIEEQSAIFAETIVTAKSYDWIDSEVVALIVKRERFDFELCGKSELEWVKLACAKIETKVVEAPDEEILQVARQHAGEKKYVLVLFSDTPLLERKTICLALDYFASKGLQAMALARGFIFKSEYLFSTSELISPIRKSFCQNQFEVVVSPDEISQASEILYQKIRDFHKSQGVIMIGEKTIFIDADVEIGSNVCVHPHNVLKGSTSIENNCTLKCGNIIEDSVIKAGTTLENKHIKGGKEL